MKKILLLIFLVALSFSMLSCAASFDCAKAGSATEKLICSDESISTLDEQLASSYKAALENAVDKEAIKKTQLEWLKQQRACKDSECLKNAYQLRIDELKKPLITKAENNSSSASSSSAVTAKNPLHFTLVEGEGYPLCKDYVEMRNATEYADTSPRACEIKPKQYKLFRLPDWVEITDKAEMAKIVTKLFTIYYLSIPHWTNEAIVKSINRGISEINENKVKMYFIKEDLDKDGTQETIYKMESMAAPESPACNNYVNYLIDDAKFTVENAKNLTPEEAMKYYGFESGTHDQLFYYGNTLFNSSWDVRDLIVHASDFDHQLCRIKTH